MGEHWKEGDPVPEGFSSDTTVGAAAHLILHAMAGRLNIDGALDVESMFKAWQHTVEMNGPEATASLLMATGALAAGAYFELARLKGAAPAALLQADAEIVEAMLAVMFS